MSFADYNEQELLCADMRRELSEWKDQVDRMSKQIAAREAALMEARDLLFDIPTPVDNIAWEEQRGGWSDGLHNIDRVIMNQETSDDARN